MVQARNIEFDILKGILIVLVVVGHALQSCFSAPTDYHPLFIFIYTFHMPLFIFVSGYFFSSCLKYDFKTLIEKKTKRLIIPLLLYSTILLGLFLASSSPKTLGRIYEVYVTYWYLICVYALTIAYYLYKVGGVFLKYTLALLLVTMIVFYNYTPPHILQDCQIIRQAIIFGIGIWFRENQERLANMKQGSKIAVIGCTLILAVAGIVIDRCTWGFNIFDFPSQIRILDGILCSVVAFIVLMPLIRLDTDNLIGKTFSYLGRYSLCVYLVHMLFFNFIRYNSYELPESLWLAAALSVVWLLLSVLAIGLLKRLKLSKPYFVGL